MFRLTVPLEIQQLIRKMHPDLKRKLRASLDLIASDPMQGRFSSMNWRTKKFPSKLFPSYL